MRRRRVPFLLVSCCLSLTAACTGSVGKSPADTASDEGEDGEGGSGAGGAAASCNESQVKLGAGKWRRLTRRQYANTIKDLLDIDPNTSNFLGDSTTGVFATNTLPPQENDIGAYAAAAEAIAAKAVENPTKLAGCDPSGADADACASKFIKEFGARAYRRELASEEVAELMETYKLGKADGATDGLRLVLQSMLQSPNFLYMVELGEAQPDGPAKLTSHEVATRLSYLMWNTTPDADLLAAARSGELDDVQGLEKQAKRLMKDPRFAGALADFHAQLLHLYRLTESDLIKKANTPEFDSTMRQAMVNEVKAMVADAFANGRANVRTLFTSPNGFPTGPMLDLYGIKSSQLTNGRYEFKDGSRSGLLTSPALMATEPPIPTPYGAVHRGKMVRLILMCEHLPPPPKELKFVTPPDAETTPQRVLLEQHQKDPSCSGCHKLMDSIGFGFENYDALGRYRTKYPKGETVDASGEIVGDSDSDVDGKFQNARELGEKLASSQQVRACLGTHWFRYAYGREPTDEDSCAVTAFAEALSQGDGDLPSSLLSFVSSNAFRFRRGVQQ